MGIKKRRSRMLVGGILGALTLLPVAAKADEVLRRAAIQIAATRLGVDMAELSVEAETNIGSVNRFKIIQKSSARVVPVNLNAQGGEIQDSAVRPHEARRRGADFRGKIEADLANRFEQLGPNETISYLIWGKAVGRPPAIDRRLDELGQAGSQIQAFKTHHKNLLRGLVESIEQRGGRILQQAENAPLLVVETTVELARTVASRPDAEAIYTHRQYKDELNVSVPAIDIPAVALLGYTGSGVKVGVVESGGIYFGHNSLADGTYCNPLATGPIGAHPTGVAGIIASSHATYKGVAPGAPALLSGNAGSYTDAAIVNCTEWAINNGARVINFSFGVDASSSMVALDRYVDYVVRNRAVTMVKSAGNRSNTCPGTDNVTSPGKGWNIITVGNYDDRGTVANADDILSSDSCFKNPTSVHGDREKPEVAAPGTSITTTYCTSSGTCTGTGSGTSFAAPHVTGCSALVMQRNSTLKYWPESVKAVLMASAVVNLEGSTRLSDKDGAGGIECDSASNVAGGVGGAESHGSYTTSSFPRTYTFAANAGQSVRVAIAWDSNTNTVLPPTTDVLNADFDLTVKAPSGAYVTGSFSWDNSYEIVEFVAPATGTYTVNVNAYRFDGSSEYLGYAYWKGVRED